MRIRWVREAQRLGSPAAVILPGTKSTLDDLAWMRAQGLDRAVAEAADGGAQVVGICGGYQVLGQHLEDPTGVEAPAGTTASGLGLVPTRTRFLPGKDTHQARIELPDGRHLQGYEIHSGATERAAGCDAFGTIVERNGQPTQAEDGAVAAGGQVWGTYLHGLFANTDFRRRWLQRIGWTGTSTQEVKAEAEYDRIADAVEDAVGWPAIAALLRMD